MPLVVAMAAIGPVLAPEYPHGGGLGLAALGALLAALAGSVVRAPVPAGPIRRVELSLRVLIAAPLATAGLLPALAGSTPLTTLLNFFACSAFVGILLAGIAFDSSLRRAAPSFAAERPLVLLEGLGEPWGENETAVAPGALPPVCALVKRSLDIVIALVALVLMLPVILLAAVATVLDSPGGWLFAQTRLGAGGRAFQMLKIRTMVADNDDSNHRAVMARLIQGAAVPQGLYGKVADDPRRTRVGKILRRLSIDELPQLLNVLRGDMSVVGPRPPLPWEAELYDARAIRRLGGKPGLTGLWQVEGRNRVPFARMVELDVRYFEHWSPWLDLKILARTPKAVFWTRHTQ